MPTRTDAAAPSAWRSLLADPAHAAGFQRLLQDVLTLPPIPEPTACGAYRAALDQFVGDWLSGAAAPAAPAHLWRHLQVCAGCQAAATTLAAWLAEELARAAAGGPAPGC